MEAMTLEEKVRLLAAIQEEGDAAILLEAAAAIRERDELRAQAAVLGGANLRYAQMDADGQRQRAEQAESALAALRERMAWHLHSSNPPKEVVMTRFDVDKDAYLVVDRLLDGTTGDIFPTFALAAAQRDIYNFRFPASSPHKILRAHITCIDAARMEGEDGIAAPAELDT